MVKWTLQLTSSSLLLWLVPAIPGTTALPWWTPAGDEVCRPIVNLIDREFGLSFNIAGLGGLVNCGKIGFKAAMSHSPVFPCDVDGKEKERYISSPSPTCRWERAARWGPSWGRGRGKPSSACGALIAIKGDITQGNSPVSDPYDEEYNLLKSKVMSKIEKVPAGGPTLVQTTKAALAAINDDLEKLISLTVDPATADYAVITGVQIHSGNQIPGSPSASRGRATTLPPTRCTPSSAARSTTSSWSPRRSPWPPKLHPFPFPSSPSTPPLHLLPCIPVTQPHPWSAPWRESSREGEM